MVKSGGLKYMNFQKGINIDFICMKMIQKLMKNKKYLQQKFSQKSLVPQTTADFMLMVSKSYVPFACKFPMVMYFVPILHRCCRSKSNFNVFSHDKTSLKFCASFRFFLAVIVEKFQKIHYLNYVKRGIGLIFTEFATSLKLPKIGTVKNKPYHTSSLRVLEILKTGLCKYFTHFPSGIFAKISRCEKFPI